MLCVFHCRVHVSSWQLLSLHDLCLWFPKHWLWMLLRMLLTWWQSCDPTTTRAKPRLSTHNSSGKYCDSVGELGDRLKMHFTRFEMWCFVVGRVVVLKNHSAFILKVQAWCSKVKALWSFQISGTTHPIRHCIWADLYSSKLHLHQLWESVVTGSDEQSYFIFGRMKVLVFTKRLHTQTPSFSSAPSSICSYSILTRPPFSVT